MKFPVKKIAATFALAVVSASCAPDSASTDGGGSTTSTGGGESATGTDSNDLVVNVEDASVVCFDCPHAEPLPPSLSAVSPGAGEIQVHHKYNGKGFSEGYEVSAEVMGDSIFVFYTGLGLVLCRLCEHEIDFLLTGVSSGTWTIVIGPESIDVDVI